MIEPPQINITITEKEDDIIIVEQPDIDITLIDA
jgi:hypothetical protein